MMKKLLALLLTLVLALSLAACGGGGNGGKMEEEKDDATYDETFTLLVGGTEAWTPFDGGDVSFENEEDTVIGLTFDSGTVTFEGLAVGKSVVTARCGDAEKTALVKVKENILEQPNADKPEQPQSGDTADGWFSEARLSGVGLSGLAQPAGTQIKDSSDTNVKLSGMTDDNYKAWVAGAFALITEKNGGVYGAETDDSFKLIGYKKIASLTASDVSTDELPSFDLVYKVGDTVYSLYILYYPVDYLGESAGYAEVRIADMTSEWGSLPFGD